jgi:hypothetical protein
LLGQHRIERAIRFALNAGFRVTSQRRTTRTNNREFDDQEIALVLSFAHNPPAVPTSTPSQLTSARPLLTKHHGCRTGRCQTQIPVATAGTVTISLCCFHGVSGSTCDFEPDLLAWVGWQNEHNNGRFRRMPILD